MSDSLFWISLASAALVFAAITVFKFSHGTARAESPQVQDLPTDQP